MILIYSFLLHFIADFVLQSREMARKKSYEAKWLLAHIAIVVAVFFLGLLPVYSFKIAILFALGNGAIHAVIDAFIWKGYAWHVWSRRDECISKNKCIVDNIVSKAGGIGREATDYELKQCMKVNYKYWEDYWFYTTMGLDQLLHVATIVLIWSLL